MDDADNNNEKVKHVGYYGRMKPLDRQVHKPNTRDITDPHLFMQYRAPHWMYVVLTSIAKHLGVSRAEIVRIMIIHGLRVWTLLEKRGREKEVHLPTHIIWAAMDEVMDYYRGRDDVTQVVDEITAPGAKDGMATVMMAKRRIMGGELIAHNDVDVRTMKLSELDELVERRTGGKYGMADTEVKNWGWQRKPNAP